MAAFCKSFLKSALCNKVRGNAPAIAISFQRFLRIDPEEEIKKQFISESFEERVSKLQNLSSTISSIGGRGSPKLIGKVSLESDQSERNYNANEQSSHSYSKSSNSPNDSHVPQTNVTRASRATALAKLQQRFDGPDPIPLDVVQIGYMAESDRSEAVQALQHYNVFNDLFNDNVYFLPDPLLMLRVAYASVDSDSVFPVYRGNKIDPAFTASSSPLVGFTGNAGKKYSLLLINLDGHLLNANGEYLHWSCVNMKGEEGLPSGTCTEYLQAIPLRGTGFHRYVFIMLEHDSQIDTSLLPNVVRKDLSSRDFNFSQFYSKLADDVVPVGIQFFQCEWDPSVRNVFHNVLDMPEPAYEYEYPKVERKFQKKYAHQQPFQTFLDMYRDKKEIAEEVLKEHLSEISPYKSLEEQQLPYPLSTPTKKGLYADQLPPTWLQKNLRHKVNKTGKYKYIYSDQLGHV